MMFSNLGRVYRMKAYELPEGSRTSKGMNIINLLPLMQDEKITVILPTAELDSEHFVCMGTKKGVIKRTELSAFKNTRKNGVIAISIDDDDELCFVKMTNGNSDILVATKKGKAIRFPEQNVRGMGRTARGVRSIHLDAGDEVIGMVTCENNDAEILTITETGYGRRSALSDYRIQSRGGKGILNYRTAKYGDVAAIIEAKESEDVIIISTDGVIIRTPISEISTYARPAKGVRVMRVAEDERVLTVASVLHDDEAATDHPDAPDADAADPGELNEPEESAEEQLDETEPETEE